MKVGYAIALAAVCICLASSAKAGFLGSSVQGDWMDPTNTTIFSSQPTVPVTSGVEYTDFFSSGPLSPLAVNISDAAVDLNNTGTSSLSFASDGFNGIRLTFTGAPAISNVTIGASSVVPVVSFDASHILINLSGLTYFGSAPPGAAEQPTPAHGFTHLDVTFAATSVPTPVSVWGGVFLIGALIAVRQSQNRARQ